MKRNAVIWLFIIFTLLITSCAKQEYKPTETGSVSETVAETKSAADKLVISDKYTIVRPENGTVSVIGAAQSLRSALEKTSGMTLKLTDDWYKNEDSIPEFEILIGDTNRPETATALATLGDDDWCCAVYGNKIVLAGREDYYTVSAVKYFIGTYVNGLGSVILEDGLFYSNREETMSFLWADARETVIRHSSWSPRVCTLSDGTVIAAYETSSGIKCARSTDGGLTYDTAHETAASFYPSLSCSNPNVFQLNNGDVLLAYRATGSTDNGFYTSLQVSISTDGGKIFTKHSTITEYTESDGSFHGVWEPCLGYLNGVLTCFYANDSRSVTKMQNIEYMQWDGSAWANRTIVCDGEKHNSRDGMPVWISLTNGYYACVIESTALRSSGYPFVVQLLTSADGDHWSEPVTVYTPSYKTSKAGAPGIAELPTGQIVISFQTDEDSSVKGDGTSVMKTITSLTTDITALTACDFAAPDNVFGTPDGKSSVWSGIWCSDGYLYATAGTANGSSLKRIEVK